MNGRRLGALLVAVALVAGAFLVRRALDGDEQTVPSTSNGTATSPDPSAPDADTVRCLPELAAVCETLAANGVDARTEEALTTFDTLVAADPDDPALPVWVTVQPFPGMVDAARAAAGDDPLGLAVEPVASTALAVAAPADGRLAALVAACAGSPLWGCIGEGAGGPWTDLGGEAAWGTVRPSLGKVETSATALVSFSAATAGYFGTTDISRSTWEADPGFTAWVRRLARTVPASSLTGRTPLATMATRPALDLAATTDVELQLLGDRSSQFTPEYPEPTMSLEAVVAAPPGLDVSATTAVMSTTLANAGWVEPAGRPAPSASATLALLQLWKDAT